MTLGLAALAALAGVAAVRADCDGCDGQATDLGPVPAPILVGGADDDAGLWVEGNRLMGPDGSAIRLIGVNRAGAEYACAQGWGIWDGAADGAFVDIMVSWGINAVRIPLNEHCWLGINEVRPEHGGRVYQDAIVEFVNLLSERGLVAVLDLHWSGPGDELALENRPMPNRDHSVEFWRSVATTFASERLVVFDLFNEPRGVEWECWRDGCDMPGAYAAVGMQELVDAVRSSGATQPVIVSGLAYANDLSGWLRHRPVDPAEGLIAGFHLYNFNLCRTRACWDTTVKTVAEEVPVVTTELGEDTCASGFTTGYMDWADDNGVSYLAWTFNPWDCRVGPALIADETGTPTPFGAGFRRHVLDLRGEGG